MPDYKHPRPEAYSYSSSPHPPSSPEGDGCSLESGTEQSKVDKQRRPSLLPNHCPYQRLEVEPACLGKGRAFFLDQNYFY